MSFASISDACNKLHKYRILLIVAVFLYF